MYLSTSELDQGTFAMPDKKAARYFAHDLFEILYQIRSLEGLMDCISLAEGSGGEGACWSMAQAASFAQFALNDINDSFSELRDMFERCNNLSSYHGQRWKEQIESEKT